jgi:hypothetical protein
METKCFSYEVGTEFINIFILILCFKVIITEPSGSAVLKCRFFITFVRVSSQGDKELGPSGQGFVSLLVCLLLFPTRLSDAVDWLFVK